MKANLYCLVNVVDGGSVNAVSMASNDGLLVRDNLPGLKRVFPYILDDMEFRCVGTVEDGGKVIPCEPRPVKWDSYKFPETQVKPMTPEEQENLRKQQ